jgi:hypothetical protein
MVRRVTNRRSNPFQVDILILHRDLRTAWLAGRAGRPPILRLRRRIRNGGKLAYVVVAADRRFRRKRMEESANHPKPSTGEGTPPAMEELLDMIWPETGLQTVIRLPRRPKDTLSEADTLDLQIDFVTLAVTPLEFIQLASSLRLAVDGLLDRHPSLQRAVINAFDIRD